MADSRELHEGGKLEITTNPNHEGSELVISMEPDRYGSPEEIFLAYSGARRMLQEATRVHREHEAAFVESIKDFVGSPIKVTGIPSSAAVVHQKEGGRRHITTVPCHSLLDENPPEPRTYEDGMLLTGVGTSPMRGRQAIYIGTSMEGSYWIMPVQSITAFEILQDDAVVNRDLPVAVQDS